MSGATSVDPMVVLFGLEEKFSVLDVQRIDPTTVKMIIAAKKIFLFMISHKPRSGIRRSPNELELCHHGAPSNRYEP